MDDETEDQVLPQDRSAPHRTGGWQVLWFFVHLAVVYAIVKFAAPWLAGWTRGRLLPLLQYPPSSSRLEFFYSHLLAFSLIPAFVSGLANARFKHKAAEYVWLFPGLILAYKVMTFPTSSVLQGGFPAFHEYFGGGFMIPEFRDYRDIWSIVSSNPDVRRGMTQMLYTAPFYAGVGYSVAAWIGRGTELHRRVAEKIKSWEQSKFEHRR